MASSSANWAKRLGSVTYFIFGSGAGMGDFERLVEVDWLKSGG